MKKCALEDCREMIPRTERHKKYHSRVCGNKAKSRAYYLRNRVVTPKLDQGPLSARGLNIVADDGSIREHRISRGSVYQQLREHPEWVSAFRLGQLTKVQLASLLGETRTSPVNMALGAIAADEILDAQDRGWAGPPAEAVEAVDDFKAFRDRYFRTEKGVPYVTEDYHLRWIEAIVAAMETGRRAMILSPPRHGKTSLLLHFCVWLIIRNPHVRIVWIAGSKDMAEDWIYSVEDELEHNGALIRDFLAPNRSFKPSHRSGRSWTRTQFTVDTRTLVVKSPTMVAQARGTRVLSRDADLIVADDIEDHASTIEPGMREKTRHWWVTDVGSRKEPHTGQVYIGSRVHPDDLAGHLLESPAWTSIVESAHDESCELDELDLEAHIDCMLSTRYPYSWLMDQRAAAETVGGIGLWEMVYLNRPTAEGIAMFDIDAVMAARDFDRDLYQYPSGSRVFAGLDPSGSGFQAGFLWAYDRDGRKLYMADNDAERGGGIARAREQIATWFDAVIPGNPAVHLGIPPQWCRQWYVEDNMFHGGIQKDEQLDLYCRERAILLESHRTNENKWDSDLGVSVMNHWFRAGLIVLPYGSTRARAKTDRFIRQLSHFSSNALSRRRTRPVSDLVMAAWFPFPHLAELDRARIGEMEVEYVPSYGSVIEYDSENPMFAYDTVNG